MSVVKTTVVQNTSGGTRRFGFLPPHGRQMTAGQVLSLNGDLESFVSRKGRRYQAALDAAVAAGALSVLDTTEQFAGGANHVSGDVNAILLPPEGTAAIEAGDLLYISSGEVYPASALADAGTEAQNQEAFHDAFVGVALQDSAAGATDPIRVATAGVFTFSCPSSSFALGALVGPDGVGPDASLADQTVNAVATANLACGRVAAATTSSTSVTVEIESVIRTGGPRAAA